MRTKMRTIKMHALNLLNERGCSERSISTNRSCFRSHYRGLCDRALTCKNLIHYQTFCSHHPSTLLQCQHRLLYHLKKEPIICFLEEKLTSRKVSILRSHQLAKVRFTILIWHGFFCTRVDEQMESGLSEKNKSRLECKIEFKIDRNEV